MLICDIGFHVHRSVHVRANLWILVELFFCWTFADAVQKRYGSVLDTSWFTFTFVN